MAGLFIEVAGDVQLARSLSRFGDGIKDFRPVWEQIVKSFWDIERKQFESEGGYGSGGWLPLSPSYAAWKEENYPGKPILQRSGALFESLTGQASGTIKQISDKSLTIGTDVFYAIFHQKGSKARPPIDLTEQDKTAFMKLIQKYVVKQAKAGGLKLT